jgi:DNA-binding NtrC family response regulator
MTPKTILLIEPDARTRELEALLLRYFGYEVQCAATAREGLHLARTDHPDLVVTEVFAPGEKALAYVSRLARAVPGAPVLLLTASGVAEDAAHLPCEVLSKPCNAEALQAAIARLAREGARPRPRRARKRLVLHATLAPREGR